MPFNGSGTFTALAPPTYPAVTGNVISATYYNNFTADLMNNGLSLVLCRDGQAAMTGNLPMGGNKITGMADGSAATDAAAFGQIAAALGTYLPLAGGTLSGALLGTTLSLSSTLAVTGAVTLTAGMTVGTTLAVTGAQTFTGATGMASFTTSGNGAVTGTFGVTGNMTGTTATFSGIVAVAAASTIGGLEIGTRRVSRSTTTTTAVAADAGKCVAITAGLTIPNATFAAGDAVSVYNDSAGALTITQGASLTLRLAGTTTSGNRTLAARGLATIWFNTASEAVISGAGVS